MVAILGSVKFTIEFDQDAMKNLPRGVNAKAFTVMGQAIAAYSADVWRAAVSGTMLPGMTAPVNDRKYASSISITPQGEYSYVVNTNYPDATKIEEGYASYDMKAELLSSVKTHQTKDGKGTYITIPFRNFTVSNSAAPSRNVIPPDILKYVREHGVMDLYEYDNEGQRTKVPVIGYNGKIIGGTNMQAIQRNMPGPMTAPYTWKNGQFSGMQKTKTKGGATRYMTFRRISTTRTEVLPDGRVVFKGSDPNSWIHPGKEANPVSEAVEEFVQPYVEQAYKAMFGEDA